MLMRTDDGAIYRDFFNISILTQHSKNGLPYIFVRPPGKSHIDAVPIPKFAW
jgi:hypothetical protein